MATKTTTGYTYKEMSDYGFFDMTLIATRIPTAEEVAYGCEYYEDCPCCTCGEDVVAVETYAGVRWSKSGKQMVETTSTAFVCSAH